jgi:hypothetical protein
MAAPRSTDYFIADLPSSTMAQSPISETVTVEIRVEQLSVRLMALDDNIVEFAPVLYHCVLPKLVYNRPP